MEKLKPDWFLGYSDQIKDLNNRAGGQVAAAGRSSYEAGHVQGNIPLKEDGLLLLARGLVLQNPHGGKLDTRNRPFIKIPSFAARPIHVNRK